MTQANLEVTNLQMRKRDHEMLVDTTITPERIPRKEQVAAQVHPLSDSIRGLGWMSYEEK